MTTPDLTPLTGHVGAAIEGLSLATLTDAEFAALVALACARAPAGIPVEIDAYDLVRGQEAVFDEELNWRALEQTHV